jgi:hypothetical protein
MTTTHLVLRVDDGPWQSVEREGPNGRLEGEELAAAVGALDGITAAVGEDGSVVLATEETGETASFEVEGAPVVRGRGPGHASLTGSQPGPYALPVDAAMTLHIDGKSRRVTFDEADHDEWAAEDVAARINRQLRRKVARVTGDGCVRITSPTQGVGSSVSVGGPDAGGPDAAAVLGLAGESDPYRAEPARLVLRPPAEVADTAVVHNLTAAPIELQLPTGRSVVPARGRLTVTRATAADGLLRRLAAQGAVRVSSERNS